MGHLAPQVSIGLPVYNGETYIREALDSILAQEFEDFELLISDNASTDKTEEICRQYAARDQRIQYFRNQENVGAAPNYNHVFHLSNGTYFKWLAHDDICAPSFLSSAVQALEQDPTIVLCHSKIKIIDKLGNAMDKNSKLYQWVGSGTRRLQTDSTKPHIRFRDAMGPHPCYQIFGLIRADTLKATPLIGSYSGSDRILLGRLALHGRFHEFSEELLYLRRHEEQSIQQLESHRSSYAYTHWFDPKTKNRIVFPTWRALGDSLTAIQQAPLRSKDKVGCYLGILPWLRRKRQDMIMDLKVALKTILRCSSF